MRKGVLQMGILDELLAGGQRQKDYSDFLDRYEQGHPSQGYSDQEVLNRYGEVSHAVSPDDYAQAAQEALSKLSPEERAMFVKMLQDREIGRASCRESDWSSDVCSSDLGGQRQKDYSDFLDRYEQGHPSQGYSDQEVLNRYGEVSHAVSPDDYAQAAQEALSKLSPEERAMFVKMLQDR